MDESGTDEAVALEAAAGSREAFETLVRRLGGALQLTLERQVGDHHRAHDLAQDVWVKAFCALPRWRPEGSFRSWLFSIAFNHVRDAERSARRGKVVYIDEYRVPPEASRDADPRGVTEERAAIVAALDGVPEPYRTALVLVDVNGLSYEEAAMSLDCALGTVKSRVNRARFAFRDHYLRQDGPREKDGTARPARQDAARENLR